MALVESRKRRLLILDLAVYLLLLIQFVIYLLYSDDKHWLVIMESLHFFVALLTCFASLVALLHIAKRIKSLESLGIFANYTIIRTYVTFRIA